MSKTITIFFADDNALYLKNLELTFNSKPYYNIKTFATAELCIEALSLKPDLIILDYYLNSVEENAMDGLHALKKIREINNTVPVVMLSTEEREDIAEKCMKHNATEFIIKGDISFARLREIITMVFLDKQIEGDLISSVHNAIRKEAGRA
ncbi:MAG: histidine kinase [Bacteroidota bacterium]|jgi:DNA-binding NarL/FixJ family response regulator|nr:histidine kinase [Bacteroidota bacterium]